MAIPSSTPQPPQPARAHNQTVERRPSEPCLSPRELHARWRGQVSLYTLKRWRSQRKGPRFVKLGAGNTSAVIYKLADVIAFENAHAVGAPPTGIAPSQAPR